VLSLFKNIKLKLIEPTVWSEITFHIFLKGSAGETVAIDVAAIRTFSLNLRLFLLTSSVMMKHLGYMPFDCATMTVVM